MDYSTFALAIIRESVSLFVLLVFLVLSYRLVDRAISLFDDFASDLLDVLQEIADSKRE